MSKFLPQTIPSDLRGKPYLVTQPEARDTWLTTSCIAYCEESGASRPSQLVTSALERILDLLSNN